MATDQLAMFGRGRRRSGRHRRQLDALARDIRRNGRTAYVDTLLDAARGHADAADALEHDGAGSIHTLNLVLSAYRQALADLRPYASDASTGSDPLADALSAAIRNSATS